MRMSMIAASALALIAADGASAQRMVMPGPGVAGTSVGMNGGDWHGGMSPGGTVPMAGATYNRPAPTGGRWGSNVNGHWWAGANAPGGWNGYRRPHRGWTLPSYWISPSFAIADWSTYGLGAPPSGYGWTRYYDDAVLVDGNGRIYDNVGGVDWNRGGYADGESGGYGSSYTTSSQYSTSDYTGAGYVQPTYGQSTYAPAPTYAAPSYAQPAYPQARGYQPAPAYQPAYQPAPAYPVAPAYAPGAGYPPPAYVERRNSGVGGALVGAGVGAVAGNLIGGRGHRLEGTLIGAGVGGVAGYTIDRSSSHRVPVAPAYGYPAPPPGYPAGAGYAPPPAAPGAWHSPDGGTIVTTSSTGGYYGGSTTVVTVQTAPVVTTTTTEIVEDHVTYVRHRSPVHHKWVRRRPACGC